MNIENIREFNRYYARILGVFDYNVFDTDYTLVEARIIGEIGRNQNITANQICEYLQMDKGYLSRILKKLEKQNVIRKVQNHQDKRYQYLQLTIQGNEIFHDLEKASNDKVYELFSKLSYEDILKVEKAMKDIKNILQQVVKER